MKHVSNVAWFDLRGLPEAYRLVALFRASNPMLGQLQPEELYWEISWHERFVPIDMDLTPADRSRLRADAVYDVSLSCSVEPDSVGPNIRVSTVPQAIRNILLGLEHDRNQ